MKKNQLEILEMKTVTVKIKKPKDEMSIRRDTAEKQINELEDGAQELSRAQHNRTASRQEKVRGVEDGT